MGKKSKTIIRDEYWFHDMGLTFVLLRLTLACNLFVIENPKLRLEFPSHGNISVMSGYLNYPENHDRPINI